MARSTIVTVLWGAGAAVLLAVGGCGGDLEEAADGEAVAQPADEGAPPDDGAAAGDGGATGDTGESGTGGAAERPGQPGGDVSAGGGGGRPGVPFDQPLFQQIGMDFDEDSRRGLEDQCAGVCTLAYSFTGDPRDPFLACRITAFSYDPPPSGGFFQAGAEVTVHVTCAPPQTAEGGNSEGGTAEAETPDEETDETTEETTDESTDESTDEGTSDAEDEVPADETAG